MDEELVCETYGVHHDIVDKVSKVMPDEEILYEAAELLKVFGDSTRIRIIFVLCQASGDDTVSYITSAPCSETSETG